VSRLQVTGLDHVVLRCADIEASLAFYCDRLGLTPDRVEEWRRGETFFPSARIDATTLIDLFPAPTGWDPTAAPEPNPEHLCLMIATPSPSSSRARSAPTGCTARKGSRRASTCRIRTATPSS
jgi:catechol 2,3-dioxygenase-like lactoylglutathione lyase family enzyme